MADYTLLFSARSNNAKTGDMPQAWVGANKRESFASCEGCPLRPKHVPGTEKNKAREDEPDCYAWGGTPYMGATAIWRALANGKDYSIEAALEKRHQSARFVRYTAIGDPARANRRKLKRSIKKTRSAGLGAVGYTHMWDDNPDLAGVLMASCGSPTQADKAIAQGFRAAVVLPSDWDRDTFETPDGHKGIVCPAIRRPDTVTCNTCGLCDATRQAKHIGFPDHGPGVSTADREFMHTTHKAPKALVMAA